MIDIPHAIAQTLLVYGVLLITLLATTRRRQAADQGFSLSVTTELKGLAIVAVCFSHIWINLASDRHFLVPLAGVSQAGVDLFLLLSGYGLSVSSLRKQQGILVFYKRLLKLFKPLWIVLTIFLILDALLLRIHYNAHTILLGYLGIYLTSDLSKDLNAPLWFVTYITVYYLLFPLVFSKRRLWLSALALFAIGIMLGPTNPPVLQQVAFLYEWHFAAFPTGMLLAWFFHMRPGLLGVVKAMRPVHQWALLGTLALGLLILNPQSHGASAAYIVQSVDLAFALVLLAIFVVKPWRFGLLGVLGAYSFEIYLLHWPILSRYDFLYGHIPAWLATVLYLLLFTALGYSLQKLANVKLRGRLNQI